jgi:uncharacterized protein with NRDE domain
MCLIALSIGQHDYYPLILAANRDEFHSRPTQEAHWWPDKPNIVGGRDLQAGGTWLAVHRNGRFATVTNFKDAHPLSPKHLSRGQLVTGFLDSDLCPHDYLATIDEDAYAGFNLIVGTADELAYMSNREDGVRELACGTYGLSNALLDGPWHKVKTSRKRLAALVDADDINETSLMRLMDNREKAPISEVEASHLEFDRAHAITAPFIVMPDYGTRCTTVVLAERRGTWHFTERRFDNKGNRTGESCFAFSTTSEA